MTNAIKELLKAKITTRQDLNKTKREISKKYNIQFLQNSEILKIYNELVNNKKVKKNIQLENILQH